eukprot:TRINITY_DN3811_c0_g1_i1.p1 TRINITY_DN3811_c0_g1~~TRINITY_DN3811_c0_g1_i1.p1  ORF type:complete len:414 (-),score=40.17 TRINITY_DN3811_c0_g1_i1:100-1341(-)
MRPITLLLLLLLPYIVASSSSITPYDIGPPSRDIASTESFLVMHDTQRVRGSDVADRTPFSQYFSLPEGRMMEIDHFKDDRMSLYFFDADREYKGWVPMPNAAPLNIVNQNTNVSAFACSALLDAPAPKMLSVLCVQPSHATPFMIDVDLDNPERTSSMHSNVLKQEPPETPKECVSNMHLVTHGPTLYLVCNTKDDTRQFFHISSKRSDLLTTSPTPWTRCDFIPAFPGAKRSNDTVVLVDNALVIIGGQFMNKYHVVDNWRIDLPSSPESAEKGGKWIQLPRLPTYNSIFGSVVFKDEWVVLCGGLELPSDLLGYPSSDVTKYGEHQGFECFNSRFNTRYSNKCISYNAKRNTFDTMYPLRINWDNPTMTVKDNFLWMAGGYVSPGAVDGVQYQGYSHLFTRSKIWEVNRL